MEIDVNPNIRLLDEVKMQARVLVPLLKALRQELGAERANRLATSALREWSRELFHRIASETPGTPREKWFSMMMAPFPRIEGDIDIENLRQDDEAWEFNVTGCRYADFFRSLGEPELGAILLCEGDDHIAEAGRGEVEFKRTQTIMKGAAYCDFRYRMRKASG
jgi:L-2-amino-thiazoline-4-carboxylic acid hydrolase